LPVEIADPVDERHVAPHCVVRAADVQPTAVTLTMAAGVDEQRGDWTRLFAPTSNLPELLMCERGRVVDLLAGQQPQHVRTRAADAIADGDHRAGIAPLAADLFKSSSPPLTVVGAAERVRRRTV